jgi:hypothetical protein
MWRLLIKALKRLLSAIRGKERPSVVPGFLRPIDTGALERELNLKELGTQRGMKELPDMGDAIFDAVELNPIVTELRKERGWKRLTRTSSL